MSVWLEKARFVRSRGLSSSLQTSKKENNKIKSIIPKNFKILEKDPDTGRIFSQTPLISFKTSKKR